MKEYAFDVKLYAVIRIKAPDQNRAESVLATAMDSAELSISISENDGTVTPVTASAYVDDIEFPFLTEVDGIPIEDIDDDDLSSVPFSFKLDPEKSLRACIQNLLNQAVERQKQASGAMYADVIMQHLVGAKLRIIAPDAAVAHGFASADAPTDRAADFSMDDAAIHVTTAPGEALLLKCQNNLSVGKRPVIVTTEDGVRGARAIARHLGIEERVDILEIEQFLAANMYERSGFRRESRTEFVRTLIGVYNEIVAAAETDPSLRIEFEI